MDTAQWPQDIVVKPMEEMVPTTCSKPSLERKIRPQKEQALNCPRCNSTSTKFCYYNNYSLSQPRYFCKNCRRYWTEGGSLRNIPVGGGSRKNKRSSASVSSSSSSISSKKLPDLVPPSISQSSQNPKIPDGQDLNLGFSATHDFKTINELIQVPNFDNNNKDNMPSSSSSTSSHLSALEFIGINPRGLNSFLPMPITSDIPSTVFSTGFPLPDFKASLNFSLDGLGSSTGYGGSLQGVQETSGRLLFPFEDLKISSTTSNDAEQSRDQNADSAGYWNGVLGGGGGGGSW